MPKHNTRYKRNLPHIQPLAHAFFVTFRLKGSIAREQLHKLKLNFENEVGALKFSKKEKDLAQLNRARKLHFKKYDDLLHLANNGPIHLANPKIAQIVSDKLFALDQSLYDLICFSIMPNHVHMLIGTAIQIPENCSSKNIEQFDLTPLQAIMKRIKGGSSYDIMKAGLKEKGVKFWQEESYDHYIRSEEEMNNVVKYILNNPVKARIVKQWEDHNFTYLKDNYWE